MQRRAQLRNFPIHPISFSKKQMTSPLAPLCAQWQTEFCSKHPRICKTFNVDFRAECLQGVNNLHQDCETTLATSEALDGSRICPMLVGRVKWLPAALVPEATSICEDVVQGAAREWKSYEGRQARDLCTSIEAKLYDALRKV